MEWFDSRLLSTAYESIFYGLKSGSGFDKTTWQENWVSSIGVSQIESYVNPSSKAFEFVTTAYNEVLPTITVLSVGDTISYWSPATVFTDF